MRQCFTADGGLTPQARAGRGFYRPHSGFPSWRASDDPQEILDEALVWAAKAGRVEVMALLVERGARLDADPYRGTPLIWAAATGRLEAARWLLDRGADVNQRATFGGPTHGQGVTALHLAAQDNCLALAELLVARGALLKSCTVSQVANAVSVHPSAATTHRSRGAGRCQQRTRKA